MSPSALTGGLWACSRAGSGDEPALVSYQIASALIDETDAICGGSWWTGLFRADLHSV